VSLNYSQIWDSFKFALQFLPNTFILLFAPLAICLFFGTIFAVIRLWKVKVLAPIITVIFTIVKGIPVYLLLVVSNIIYIIYFDSFAESIGLSISTADIDPKWFAVFILSFSFMPGVSEMIRAGLISVGEGQFEAGYAVGLTRIQTLRRIIFPQMIPEIMPILTSTMINLVKAGALAYSLGVVDVLNAAVRAASNAYDLLEGYIAAAIIYWGLSIIIELVMGYASKRVGTYRKVAL